MAPPTYETPTYRGRLRPGGFALIVALALMSFILLLMLSLGALLQLEIMASTKSQDMALARANARAGLMVALGELQKYAGADQRLTVRGEALAAEIGGGTPLDPTADGRAMWVGVIRSDGDPTQPPLNFDTGHPVRWLASGVDPGSNDIESQLERITFVEQGDYLIDVFDAAGNAERAEGAAVEAGLVELENGSGVQGGFAWFIDDEGMKGKLRTRALDNDDEAFVGGAVLPGNFSPARLTGLGAFSGSDPGNLAGIFNLGGLKFYDVDRADLRTHQFDYTLNSYGVLSNVRDGGLRGDLSVAMEDTTSFNAFFDNGDMLLVDPDRLVGSAAELVDNDYISWKIFRDYYRLKDLLPANPMNSDNVINASSMFENWVNVGQTPFKDFGDDAPPLAGPHSKHRHFQSATLDYRYYGSYSPHSLTHNPLKPILAYMYFEFWVNIVDRSDSGDPDAEADLWAEAWIRPYFGFYNPYNVILRVPELYAFLDQNIIMRITDSTGKQVNLRDFWGGATADNYTSSNSAASYEGNRNGWLPIIRVGVGEDDTRFLTKRDLNATIPPGNILALSFDSNVDTADTQGFSGSNHSGLSMNFSTADQIGALREIKIEGDDYTGPFTVEFQTFHDDTSGGNPDSPFFMFTHFRQQPYQWMVQPYAYDSVDTYVLNSSSKDFHGKRFVVEDVDLGAGTSTNYSNAARFGMWMRTTTEEVDQVRPLIDGNIRAPFVNPRWDVDPTGQHSHGLGIRTVATYTGAPVGATSKGSIDFEIPVSGTDGFNLWGIYYGEPGNPSNSGGDFPATFPNFGMNMSVWGAGHSASDGVQRVVLFDVPREPLVSLGQFQHAEAGHYSYEPTYIVGNSYANVRIPLDDWRNEGAQDTFSDWDGVGEFRIPGSFNLYDASYLVNEVLWDGYIFTTIPQDGDEGFFNDVLSGGESLPNPRFAPYEPTGLRFDANSLTTDKSAAYRRNAGMVLSDGAFNVNSISVSAWEAFLSSTAGLPVTRLGYPQARPSGPAFEPTNVRFPRATSSMGGSDEFWDGYGELDPARVRELAEAIVFEVRRRGPFRSLGEFVNRWNPDDGSIPANDERRKSGALQAALDRSINNNSGFGVSLDASSSDYEAIPANATQASGFSGHILQGDVLQALSPYMNVRSDTFRIRAMGRANNPLTGEVLAEAWCEVIVQRVPDPVLDDGMSLDTDQLVNPASDFGRRFEVVSFRWLDQDQI